MSDPKFFGYGSLVNLRTHTYANPVPTTLNGWRRVWKPAGDCETSFLSIERVEGGQIDGMIAAVPKGDWGALDAREAAYDHVDVSVQFRGTAPVAIYQGRPEKIQPRISINRSCSAISMSSSKASMTTSASQVSNGFLHQPVGGTGPFSTIAFLRCILGIKR